MYISNLVVIYSLCHNLTSVVFVCCHSTPYYLVIPLPSSQASLKYRNTDKIVREYPVGPSNDENQPFVSEHAYHGVASPTHSNSPVKIAT